MIIVVCLALLFCSCSQFVIQPKPVQIKFLPVTKKYHEHKLKDLAYVLRSKKKADSIEGSLCQAVPIKIKESFYFLTSEHCVDGSSDHYVRKIHGSWKYHKVEVVDKNKIFDLAILKSVKLLIPSSFAAISHLAPQKFDAVFQYHFETTENDSKMIVTQGHIKAHLIHQLAFFNCFQISFAAVKGNSGSGIYNIFGNLIGIQSQSNNLHSYVTPWGDIVRWLRSIEDKL